jgi:hypothetical protein
MTRQYLGALAVLAAFPATDALAQSGPSCSSVSGYPIVCIVSAGATVSVTSTASNVIYAWDSTDAVNKTTAIGFACTSSLAGFTFTVKDEIGTAGAFPIAVTPNGSDTIDAPGGPMGVSFTLDSNYESITFQCDGNANGSGNGNWMVE